MIVYRVENDNGRGPYRPGWNQDNIDLSIDQSILATEIGNAHNDDNLRPAPWIDGIKNWDFDDLYEPRFGFMSIGELIQWFDGWLDFLELYGYSFRAFEIEDQYVIVGKRQVVFDYVHAKLLA